MKSIAAIIMIFISCQLNAQLLVNAGNDRGFCATDSVGTFAPLLTGTDTLGGMPTASNGVPPYTYKWECKDSTGFVTLGTCTASYFLNDTIIANPKLIVRLPWNKSITFFVTVIDSVGNTGIDSVRILKGGIFNSFETIEKEKGIHDTILQCPNIDGDLYPPFQYAWQPFLYISDSTVRCPRFWNPTFMSYQVNITDSLGCESGFNNALSIWINDNNVGIPDIEVKKHISNFQNPINSNTVFELLNRIEDSKVEIYTITGQKIYAGKAYGKLDIGAITNSNGIYLLTLYTPSLSKPIMVKVVRE